MLYYIGLNFILILLGLGLYCKTNNGQVCVRLQSGHLSIGRGIFFIVFSSIVLCLFMGFRSDFTSDYQAYARAFRHFSSESLMEVINESNPIYRYYEIGYRLFNKFVSWFTNSTTWFMMAYAIVFIGLVMNEGRREVNDMLLFTMLFVNVGSYYLSFNMMRQAFAGAIIYTGTKYLLERKWIKYIIVIAIAASIHRTSIVMMFVFPLLLMQPSKKNTMFLIGIGVAGYVFLPGIISFVQRYVYSGYTYNMGSAEGFNAVIVQWSIAAFVIWRRIKAPKPDSMLDRVMFNGVLLYLVISVLQLRVVQLSRLNYFFSFFLVASGANAVEEFSCRPGNRIFYVIVLVLLIAYACAWVGTDPGYSQYSFALHL